jgi:hypothetical protein
MERLSDRERQRLVEPGGECTGVAHASGDPSVPVGDPAGDQRVAAATEARAACTKLAVPIPATPGVNQTRSISVASPLQRPRSDAPNRRSTRVMAWPDGQTMRVRETL